MHIKQQVPLPGCLLEQVKLFSLLPPKIPNSYAWLSQRLQERKQIDGAGASVPLTQPTSHIQQRVTRESDFWGVSLMKEQPPIKVQMAACTQVRPRPRLAVGELKIRSEEHW